MGSILAFLVAIALLVFVHEYGHYAVARWCGVRVLRFSIGFGRPLLKWTNPRTGVEWVVGWLPLGGYVRMLDERDPESLEALQAQQDKERDKEQGKADRAVLPAPAGEATLDQAQADPLAQAFNRKSVWQRIAIVLAGPVANLALAVLLYAVLAWLQPNGQDTVVATPPAGSPAATVGLMAGDRIVAVNGKSTHTWSELSWQLLKANVRGVPVVLQVEPIKQLGETQPGQTRSLAAIEAEQLGGLGPAVVAQLGLFAKEQRVLVRAVQPGSAGERAGFQAGDELLRVDGVVIERAGQLTAAIQAKPGQPVAIEGQRQGAVFVLQATPDAVQDPKHTGHNIGKDTGPNTAQGRLGLSLQGEPKRVDLNLNPWQALVAGADKTVEVSTLSLLALGKMVVGQLSLEHLSGPIAIASAAGESSRLGLLPFVAFLAMVSVSLGVLNLLPIPVLDGGHLVYYLAEAVRGKPLSEAWQAMGQKVGLALLLLLTSVALFNDVQNILIN